MKRNAVTRLMAMTCSMLLILSGILAMPAQAQSKTPLPKLDEPTSSLAAGTYDGPLTIRLSGPAGVTIRYTINGRTPTASSTRYTKPITVTKKTTVKAIAVKKGYSNSSVFAAIYNVQPIALAAPVASLASGTYEGTQTVRLSGPAGATIRYTTNGKTPTACSTKYTKPIKVDKGMTIKAIAVRTGYANSPVMIASFTLKVPDPGPAYIPASKTLTLGGGSIKITAPKETTIYLKLKGIEDDVTVSTQSYDAKILPGKTATLVFRKDTVALMMLTKKGFASNTISRAYTCRGDSVVPLGDQFCQKVLDGLNWSRETGKFVLGDGTVLTNIGPASLDGRLSAIAQAHAMKLATENQLYHTGYDIDESICSDVGTPESIGAALTAHNPNLCNPNNNLIGVGAARALDGTMYVVVEGGSEEKVAALADSLGIR